MKPSLTMKRLALLSVAASMVVATALPVGAEDRLVEGAMILAPAEGSRMETISEDTLEACVARIPERVTPDQRMMAQQVCDEEEARRKLELAIKGD